jgi:hypothetical protein
MKINLSVFLSILILLGCSNDDEVNSEPIFTVVDPYSDGLRDIHYYDENNGIRVFFDFLPDQSYVELKTDGKFIETFRTAAGNGANPELVMASENKGYFIAGGYLYLTTNRGISWTLIEGSLSINELFPITENILFAYASGFVNNGNTFKVGLFKSTDGGYNWSFMSEVVSSPFNNLYFINEQIGFVGSQNVVYRTNDGGINWEAITLPKQGSVFDIYFINSLNGYLTMGDLGYVYATSNGGLSWKELGKVEVGSFSSFREIYFREDGQGIITADGFGTSVWYSADSGNTVELLIDSKKGIFSPMTPIISINNNSVIVLAERIVYKIDFK